MRSGGDGGEMVAHAGGNGETTAGGGNVSTGGGEMVAHVGDDGETTAGGGNVSTGGTGGVTSSMTSSSAGAGAGAGAGAIAFPGDEEANVEVDEDERELEEAEVFLCSAKRRSCCTSSRKRCFHLAMSSPATAAAAAQ
mmetsp:Transcript_40931/g.118240  ORF Transcript_40931/g.118240 Transcript_40931/m.118240 type:complete len:138 (+) Transcript_40931:652-1065(+)